MKIILVAIAVVFALAPVHARAGERLGDAALGAISGAVVLGPVGLVAGAVVGYTAGPTIAHSWRNSHPPRVQARTAGRRRRGPAGPGAGIVPRLSETGARLSRITHYAPGFNWPSSLAIAS